MLKNTFVAALLLLALTGCQTSYDDMIGSGPITLAGPVEKMYENYLLQKPAAFAVTEDGKYASYYYCPGVRQCAPPDRAMLQAIQSCEERSRGRKCKVFAVKDSIVWKGYSGKQTLEERMITVDWEKYPDLLHGYVDYNKGVVQIRSKSGLKCTATESNPDADSIGTWTAECDDGTTAKGTFKALGSGKGSLGSGQDNDGNKLRYAIAPATLD